jgi:hypothetical protein
MAKRERRFHLDFLQESLREGRGQGQARAFSWCCAPVASLADDAPSGSSRALNPDLLETWVARAVTVRCVDDLFDAGRAA